MHTPVFKTNSMEHDSAVKMLSDLFQKRDREKLESLGGSSGIENALRAMEREKLCSNRIPIEDKKKIRKIVEEQLEDATVRCLCVFSGISVAAGAYDYFTRGTHSYLEGLSILCAVVFTVGVGCVGERRKESSVLKLEKSITDIQVKVARNGVKEIRNSSDLLLGDRVYVENGDVVPADMVLIEGYSLSCDESLVTGESEGVLKCENDPFLVSGTHVISGAGTGLVVAVGEHSSRGKVAAVLRNAKKRKTRMQKRLEKLVKRLAGIGTAISVTTCAVKWYRVAYGLASGSYLQVLFESLSLAAVAIPEGLPVAATMSLAFAALNMYRNNALVRNISKCEVMNSATVICIDKTGTLTKNAMEVMEVFCNGRIYAGEAPESREVLEEISLGVLANSSLFISNGKMHGSKTEMGLVTFLKKYGMLFDLEIENSKRAPFCPTRKYMATYISSEDLERASALFSKHFSNGSAASGKTREAAPGRVFYKGAPEVILQKCTHMVTENGIQIISEDLHSALALFTQTYRCVAMAYKEGSEIEIEKALGLVFVSLFGIEDPIRENAPECISACKRAGIKLKMVTGDGKGTALHIAQQAGMAQPGDLFLSGEDFRSLGDEEAACQALELKILYRSTPEDKLRLVSLLKQAKEIVCVTGDGANDAPALKSSDIGYSMGSGTEIAKRASDVVLLTDEFSSLVNSIAWGRCVGDNIKKFCQFQLTLTASVASIAIADAFTSVDLIGVSPARLLWLNAVGDTIGSLALSSNRPSAETANRLPEPVVSSPITKDMFLYIAVNYLCQICTLAHFYRLGASSAFRFNYFVFLQIFGMVGSNSLRTSVGEVLHALQKNRILLASIGFASLCQITWCASLLWFSGVKPPFLLFELVLSTGSALCASLFSLVVVLAVRRLENSKNAFHPAPS